MEVSPLRKAVSLRGGQVALAEEIGKKQQTVSDWLNKPNREVPLEDAIRIELATGREVRAGEIRPDLQDLLNAWAPKSERKRTAA